MSKFNAKLTTWQTHLKRLVHVLHKDQRGTSLTEFVICLPVFIIIFAGVVNLNKVQRTAMSVKVKASSNVWSKAIPVQSSYNLKHMSPTAGGAMVAVHALSHSTHKKADKIDRQSGIQLGMKGHFGESYEMVNPAESYADFNFDLEQKGGPVYNDREYSRDLLEDKLNFNVAGGNLLSVLANSVLNFTGARPAIAAGVRYGLVHGDATRSVAINGKKYNFEASYNVLVAPKPTDEIMTTAITRLTAESYKEFADVLGIEQDDRL